jgi:benzylsuccinate CoA-transferase BbsF subunit
MQQAYADYIAGIHGAFALLAALRHRKNTGSGQYIDMAQLEALIGVFPQAFMQYFMTGSVPGTMGNSHPAMAPHNNYRCRGEDRWVSIAVGSETEWNHLCAAMGNPSWTEDEKFADRYVRWKNREELDRLISRWTIAHTDVDVMEILQKAGVAAMPCMDVEARYFDPHFKERNMFPEVTHPESGAFVVTNTPWKMSKVPDELHKGAPRLGEHNDYVFGKLLGLSKEEIGRLEQEKVIY